MQQVGNLGSIAGNFGIINPLVFNQFGYGTYAQVGQLTRHRANLMESVNSHDTGGESNGIGQLTKHRIYIMTYRM